MSVRPAVGLAAATALLAACASGVSDDALDAAEIGCEHLAEELDRGDIIGTISAPLVLRRAHATVEPDVDIDEFTAATQEICPDTLATLDQQIDDLGP